MKKVILIICLMIISSSLLFADGQDSFIIINGTIDLIEVFIIWTIIAFGGLFLINRIRKEKIGRKKKRLILMISALIALFIWSMIIYDTKPYEGPIDSIFYKSNGEKRF